MRQWLSIQTVSLTLMVLIALALFLNWGQLTVSIIDYQQQFHRLLAGYVKQVKNEPLENGLLLIFFSVLYGVFHAAGPGHGKAVLVTYLSTQKETFRQGVAISFIAAMVQSLVAIGLIAVLVKFLNFTFRDAQSAGMQVEQVGYGLVILIGLFLVIKTLVTFWPRKQTTSAEHEHSDNCAHHYAPESTRLNRTQMIALVLSMGLRPCSGAVLVLIYAQITGVFEFGVIATLAMGLGTGSAVALLAWLTVFARERVIALTSDYSEQHSHHRIGKVSSLLGGLILIWLGWGLLQLTMAVSQSHPLL